MKGRGLRERDVSVTALLKDLKWEPLQERRRQLRLTLMYKIVNGEVAVPTTRLMPAHQRTRAKHPYKYATIRTNCDIAKKNFREPFVHGMTLRFTL